MGKYVKNNKKSHLFTFLSLLTMRDLFEEMKLGFLVVGHTYEDVDGCFGYLSRKLRKQNNYVLVDLMRVFMVSQE
jgi:hypothetical protein